MGSERRERETESRREREGSALSCKSDIMCECERGEEGYRAHCVFGAQFSSFFVSKVREREKESMVLIAASESVKFRGLGFYKFVT